MKKQILTLKEILKVALLSYDKTLITFNKSYTKLKIIDFENYDYFSEEYLNLINSKYNLIIDKNLYNDKEIKEYVKEFYLNNIENNKNLNSIKKNNNIIKEYSKDILNHFNNNNYARVLISKNLKHFVIFNFNERYSDESIYEYELLINNRREIFSKNEIKYIIKDFFDNINYFIKN